MTSIKHLTCLAVAITLFTSACTSHRATLAYKDFETEVDLMAKDRNGQNLGYVWGDAGGFGWSGCTARAKMSLQEMIETARAKGANAIGEIYWDGSGSSQPACKRAWGFAVFWPFLLTPLFMISRVEGIAMKNPSKKAKREGVYTLDELYSAVGRQL